MNIYIMQSYVLKNTMKKKNTMLQTPLIQTGYFETTKDFW